MRIMRAFSDNLIDQIEVHGYGKEHVTAVHNVIWGLGSWVTVMKISTGQGTGRRHIIVKC